MITFSIKKIHADANGVDVRVTFRNGGSGFVFDLEHPFDSDLAEFFLDDGGTRDEGPGVRELITSIIGDVAYSERFHPAYFDHRDGVLRLTMGAEGCMTCTCIFPFSDASRKQLQENFDRFQTELQTIKSGRVKTVNCFGCVSYKAPPKRE